MTKTARFASALFLSLAALGAAHAATAAERLPGDNYGYGFRSHDVFADGARTLAAATLPGDKYGYEFRSHDAFTDGARAGKPDPYVDGARTVAGLDRRSVSAAPARSFDPYSEGSRVGGFDPYGEGARA
ncbi:hypothetical protein [Cupriavidus consociatus]|uniref:hypothetical protein n=1 Tax=Cupriavidus consociatus TaxID=2821357 RepID=UPI001AEB4FB1|nr:MULTISPECIES: hypothetical protein [unclassified Cupriavidus]MBP0619925.1 hypothetical protein [Cupriavidus sp. LEh25]MDK2656580.1 hypothetical protein [Cupriavidus sp. LEh21]